MGNYDDIINETWPKPSSRKPMDVKNRAKIFLPFAALKGFEDEVEKQRSDLEKEMNDTTGYIQFDETEFIE